MRLQKSAVVTHPRLFEHRWHRIEACPRRAPIGKLTMMSFGTYIQNAPIGRPKIMQKSMVPPPVWWILHALPPPPSFGYREQFSTKIGGQPQATHSPLKL